MAEHKGLGPKEVRMKGEVMVMGREYLELYRASKENPGQIDPLLHRPLADEAFRVISIRSLVTKPFSRFYLFPTPTNHRLPCRVVRFLPGDMYGCVCYDPVLKDFFPLAADEKDLLEVSRWENTTHEELARLEHAFLFLVPVGFVKGRRVFREMNKEDGVYSVYSPSELETGFHSEHHSHDHHHQDY